MQNPFASMKWWSILWAFGISALLRYFGLNLGMWGSLGVLASLSLVGWFSDLKPEIRKWIGYGIIGVVTWQLGPAVYDWICNTPYVGGEIDLRKTDTQMKIAEGLHPSGVGERDALRDFSNNIETSEAQKVQNDLARLKNEYDHGRISFQQLQQKTDQVLGRIKENASFRDRTRKFIITDGFDPDAQDVKNQIDTFLGIPHRYLFWGLIFLIILAYLASFILSIFSGKFKWLPKAAWCVAILIGLAVFGDKLVWGGGFQNVQTRATVRGGSPQSSGPVVRTISIRPDQDSAEITIPRGRPWDFDSPGSSWLAFIFASGEKIGVARGTVVLTRTDGTQEQLAAFPAVSPSRSFRVRGDGGTVQITIH